MRRALVNGGCPMGQTNTIQATADVESIGVNFGVDVNYNGFNMMGSYYVGDALGTALYNLTGTGDRLNCNATTCEELQASGFILQGAYTYNGKTKFGVSYGESTEDGNGTAELKDIASRLLTIGVYHDVTSWLKVVAEYGQQDSDTFVSTDVDIFSVGGFHLLVSMTV